MVELLTSTKIEYSIKWSTKRKNRWISKRLRAIYKFVLSVELDFYSNGFDLVRLDLVSNDSMPCDSNDDASPCKIQTSLALDTTIPSAYSILLSPFPLKLNDLLHKNWMPFFPSSSTVIPFSFHFEPETTPFEIVAVLFHFPYTACCAAFPRTETRSRHSTINRSRFNCCKIVHILLSLYFVKIENDKLNGPCEWHCHNRKWMGHESFGH